MTDEAYFRTVLTVEVLTQKEAWNGDFEELAEDCVRGDASGAIVLRVVEQCSTSEMARLLIAQGSDPEFLGITGNSTDWERG